VQPSIQLTGRDLALLNRLVDESPPRFELLVDVLAEELRRATIVEAGGGAEFVQLGSTVTWENLETGHRRTARLVLPDQVRGPDELSVLTPVGCALIGVRVGDVFTWVDGARHWRLRVVAVTHA
jgi:regulator of nucleoside diphosphate kinase